MTHKNNYSIHKIKGYTIILVPNKNETLHISACIESGTINETKGNAGIHHLVEHILTEAWEPCGKQTCNSYWDKKGVIMNANTTMSYVNFYVNGLKEDTDLMLDYMINIIVKPSIKESTLKIEKHAVLNELLILTNDPENKGEDAFNKEFFSIEGLKYTADFKTQMNNLNKLSLKKIKHFYNEINQNIVFIISGGFDSKHILSTFAKSMHEYNPLTTHLNVFTFSNSFIYVKDDIKSTILMMGIPISINPSNYHKMEACLKCIHSILFQVLRIEMKMIYGIEISLHVLPAPYIIIRSTVENKHVVSVYHTIIEIIEKYKTVYPEDYMKGIKQKEKLAFYNIPYTSTFLSKYYLKEYLQNKKIIPLFQKMRDIQKINSVQFLKLMNIDLSKCLVVYQGKVKVF